MLLQDILGRGNNNNNIHYDKNNTNFPHNSKPISDWYTVTFLQQTSNFNLDISELYWIHLLDASINI